MHPPGPFSLQPLGRPPERPAPITANLGSFAAHGGYYHALGRVGGHRLFYDDLSAFNWWSASRLDDPVRVRLSESLDGIFVDATLELAFLILVDLPIGGAYRIGDELQPAVDLYNFTIVGRSLQGGLISYEGETLLAQLDRVRPSGSLVLLPGLNGVPDPLTPRIALERLLELYGIPHGPLPDFLIRVPGGTLPLTMEAFVFQADPDDRTSLYGLLQEFLAPFAGYRFRANASNELDIAAPFWADPDAETLLLTQADLAPGGVINQRADDIVNACEVTVQGFTFVDDQPIMQSAVAVVRGNSSTRRGTNSTYNVPGILEPEELPENFLEMLDETLPVGQNLPTDSQSNPLQWNMVVWPAMEDVTAQPGGDINVTTEVRIYRRAWESLSSAPVDESVSTVSAVSTLPTDGSRVQIWPEDPGQHWYPRLSSEFDNAGERGRGQIFARWDAGQNDGAGGVVLEIGHQPAGNGARWLAFPIFTNIWYTYAIEVRLNGTATTWRRSDERTVHRFGYTQEDRDALPGLGDSQTLYQLRERRIDMGWFMVRPEDALAIARAIVEENYNPKLVHQLTIVPSGPEGYRAKPWHVGRPAQLPDGNVGRLTSWHYEEAHAPAQSASSVQVEIEVANPLVQTRAAKTHYGAASYRVGKYGG